MKLKAYANKKGIQIIGDIPLYVALDSADVWVDREEFQLDKNGCPTLVAGCPPDAFSDDGQKWGNPLYDWDIMEQNGFDWWKKRMIANAKLYDVIRIDHFIGVVRYYSIPVNDDNAKNGRWRKGPGKKLTDAIEEVLGAGKIIAEDLGVSVPGVKKLMDKTGWPGMKILQFAFDGNTSHDYLPHNYNSRNIVVYAGTHDNETLVGYFRDKTEYELAFLYEYLNINSKEEIADALIRLAYSSTANVVIFQMQDLLKLGNEARMNLPSTVGKNWRWRALRDSLDDERRTWIRTMAIIYRR
jgi:4-alpha-glucanotransferase